MNFLNRESRAVERSMRARMMGADAEWAQTSGITSIFILFAGLSLSSAALAGIFLDLWWLLVVPALGISIVVWWLWYNSFALRT